VVVVLFVVVLEKLSIFWLAVPTFLQTRSGGHLVAAPCQCHRPSTPTTPEYRWILWARDIRSQRERDRLGGPDAMCWPLPCRPGLPENLPSGTQLRRSWEPRAGTETCSYPELPSLGQNLPVPKQGPGGRKQALLKGWQEMAFPKLNRKVPLRLDKSRVWTAHYYTTEPIKTALLFRLSELCM
jgi:hypothetical protein